MNRVSKLCRKRSGSTVCQGWLLSLLCNRVHLSGKHSVYRSEVAETEIEGCLAPKTNCLHRVTFYDNDTYCYKIARKEDMEAPRSLLIIYTLKKCGFQSCIPSQRYSFQEERMMLCSTDVSLERIPHR